MLPIQLKRINLTGEITEITFEYQSGKYLVKNFSNRDIFVSFEKQFDETKAIKIASGNGQVCFITEIYSQKDQAETKTLYIKGTGEIEVQQLWFH